jgi:hypothetical protein
MTQLCQSLDAGIAVLPSSERNGKVNPWHAHDRIASKTTTHAVLHAFRMVLTGHLSNPPEPLVNLLSSLTLSDGEAE